MSDLKLTVEPGTPIIRFTRTFDGPRELVFKAFTDPEAIPRWWGPAKYRTKVERLEARFGGAWRFTQVDDDGNEFAFHGVFHEATPERLVQTFEFEGYPGHVSLNSMTLEDTGDGRTKITTVSVFQSVADRDGMVQSGMESGMEEGFVRMDRLLRDMKTSG